MKHEILWYTENDSIKDSHGRARILRGFNFGGIKAPQPVENGKPMRFSAGSPMSAVLCLDGVLHGKP